MNIRYAEIDIEDIEEVSKKLSEEKFLLIGDLCLDSYYFCDPDSKEISVETGQIVENVLRVKRTLGGLGNVANNLSSLGVKNISVCSLIGSDMEGMQVVTLLKEIQVDTSLLFVEDTATTPTYSKFIKNNQEILRIDRGKEQNIVAGLIDHYINVLSNSIVSFDFIIINQQLMHGFIREEFFKKLLDVLEKNNIKNVIIDTRDYPHLCDNFDLKVNDFELSQLIGDVYGPLDSIPFAKISTYLKNRRTTMQGTTICTVGESGACFIENDELVFARSFHVLPPIDTVGAGDSFVAGYSVGISAGLDRGRAIALGNAVSMITITKLHTTGSASIEEIKKALDNSGYVYNIDYSYPTRLTDEMEIITSCNPSHQFSIGVFDFDGTLSILREGWQKIMQETLCAIILEKKPNYPTDMLYADIDDLIHQTTGIQTIEQMILFKNMLLLKYGFETQEVLEAMEYKEIYLKNLQSNVEHRKKRIKEGFLSPDDFRIKGALDFLNALQERGIEMYLASGTDHACVIEEVEILGLKSFFENRIQGSVNDVGNDPKKKVLRSLMKNISGDIIVFGDGPVELRVGRQFGAYCCGVMSDEARGHGWDLSKKERLVKAGSHMLVPDFSNYKQILKEINLL